MRNTLVAVSIRMLATALLFAAAAPAHAQEEQILVNVPFDFVVGKTTLKAGTYMIRPADEDPSVLSFRSKDSRNVALALTTPVADDVKVANPELVFEKRDNQYVLARVVEDDGNERGVTPMRHAPADHEVVLAVTP